MINDYHNTYKSCDNMIIVNDICNATRLMCASPEYHIVIPFTGRTKMNCYWITA